MKAVSTPHPHRRLSALPVTNETEEDEQATPAPAMHKVFAGVTPRPRRGRMSHPLSQAYIPDIDASEAENSENLAPHDDASERGSVISTTSSQDLVTHVRANTSYDPALGLGERGKMGRFDAQKLNTYLHGLNHRLQEENIDLIARLQKYEEVKQGPRLSIESAGRGRRISAVSSLGDVEEESGVEGWAEERLELEALVQKMTEDIEQMTVEKDQMSQGLEKERKERARDKERWRERMAEVEKGVSGIISELEQRVEEAEGKYAEAMEETDKIQREADKVQDRLEEERNLALERADEAEGKHAEAVEEITKSKREAERVRDRLAAERDLAIERAEDAEAKHNKVVEEVNKVKREAERIRNRLETEHDLALERAEEAEGKRADALGEINKIKREAEKVRDRLEAERDLALERAAKADCALESGKELGGALKEANTKISMLSSDLLVATAQIKDLEDEGATLRRKADGLQKELKEEKLSNKLAEEDLHSQLSEMGAEVMRATARVSELQRELRERDTDLDHLEGELQVKSDELAELQRYAAQGDKETAEELRSLKSYITELEDKAAERVKDLQERLARAQDRVDQYEVEEEHANDRMERLEKEAERVTELARQMEEALEAAEEKMKSDEETMADLRGKMAALEREQERQRDLTITKSPSNHEAEEALEAELDEANREIARLSALLQQSPARRAIDKAKDARIEALEREKEELLERVRALKSSNAEMATPHRVVNNSGISPIHRHVLSMSLKAPKTPGAPLKDVRHRHHSKFESEV